MRPFNHSSDVGSMCTAIRKTDIDTTTTLRASSSSSRRHPLHSGACKPMTASSGST